jgi:hypothetical protein
LINSEKVSFVGAWTLFGFHEDGFTSGIRAAERLGAKIPFEIVDARYIRGRKIRQMDSRSSQWEIGRMILVFIQWVIMALSGFQRTQKGKLE